MAQQPSPAVENHFIAGLKTEFTGLNFPENAATDTQNCVYTLIGDVNRRGGINYEANFSQPVIGLPGAAKSSFRWLNAGGDGLSQILVMQIGAILYFFLSSSATIASPLSSTLLASQVNIRSFQAAGSTPDPLLTECQFTSGNGYLFVFHPNCDSFYCTYSGGNVLANRINIQTRDFVGIPEPGILDNFRPNTLNNEHKYNLINQGWTQGSAWNATGVGDGSGNIPKVGGFFTVNISSQSNTTAVTPGSTIQILISQAAKTGSNNNNLNGSVTLVGTVTSYSTPFSSLTIGITSNSNPDLKAMGFWSGGNFGSTPLESLSLTLTNVGFINTWFGALANYPSNADIWWLYKNTSNAFDPITTFANVQQLTTSAPKGSFVLNPFIQDRTSISSIPNLTTISTSLRPLTGTFFQGRVFYAGVNSSFPATGDEPFYTWTENIYFSQIVTDVRSFGKCFQENDPTSQTLFDLLPSDGGQIVIPGCGAIYKLFALRFGVLVFAANGIWFISGSTGVGFAANDHTITKISSIRAISGTSFIDVQGYPYFWNEEGIYKVVPSSQPGSAHSPDIQLSVENLTLGTILSYYEKFPLISKMFARGDYDELSYIVQWCFKSTSENGINDRYNYDIILNYNTVTNSFYPYTLPNSASSITDIKYIQNPGGIGSPTPIFKYITSRLNFITFSEENDFIRYVDFFSENSIGYNYISFFITGYRLPGKALTKFQTPYIYVFSRNPSSNSYFIQSIWDYAGSGLSGRWSVRQQRTNSPNNFTNMYHKIRLRGRGLAMQIKVTSVDGKPFDLMGWGILNEVSTGI